mgnify:CR=1 FL=1|tara:strand:- start:1424 stop:1939 length:516 start_codon:yes stop_codon:yes gene_type:complete
MNLHCHPEPVERPPTHQTTMPLNIVLIHPEIPNNTGNIGRLSLGSGCNLHLVKPFGFKIDDSRLKRAGLDYWKHLAVTYYDSIEDFFETHADKNMAFLSSHGTKSHFEIPFEDGQFLIFGKESKGLPKEITEKYPDQLYKIPLFSKHIRSLNLANAVGIVAYEGIRQLAIK